MNDDIFANLKQVYRSLDIIENSIGKIDKKDIFNVKLCIDTLKVKMDDIKTIVDWSSDASKRNFD